MDHAVTASKPVWRLNAVLTAAVLLVCAIPADAQTSLMNCREAIQQDPAKILRSGIWRQWIYWITPGPDAYAAVQRVVAEVNSARVMWIRRGFGGLCVRSRSRKPMRGLRWRQASAAAAASRRSRTLGRRSMRGRTSFGSTAVAVGETAGAVFSRGADMDERTHRREPCKG